MVKFKTSPSNSEQSVSSTVYRSAVNNGVALKGKAVVPGDKSISHRAILLGALAYGETTVEGLLEGEDVLRSAAAMRALGADIERSNIECSEKEGQCGETSKTIWTIKGPIFENLRMPNPHNSQTLYFGNAGTGARLTLGLVAGLCSKLKRDGQKSTEDEKSFQIGFDGDQSLRARPMGRILEPLQKMGAKATSKDGKLPVCLMASNPLKAVHYQLPVPSAQIKSAILLAGLNAEGTTTIDEPILSRDHTENMFIAFGVDIKVEQKNAGRMISLVGGQKLKATHITVPGDPSSAAFLIAAALIIDDSDITLPAILMNPMRIGFITTVKEMGADITIFNERRVAGEDIADLRIRKSKLIAIDVPAERAPSMIDEYPILAIIAAFAKGDTVMAGIGELRVKESDRIAAMEDGLSANGVAVESGEDWLLVKGDTHPQGGAPVKTYHDHRIAMSFLILSMVSKNKITIDSADMIATSFPNFFKVFKTLGADFQD